MTDARVPSWLLSLSPGAVKAYAWLDVCGGRITNKRLAANMGLTAGRVSGLLSELRQAGAIATQGRGRHVLARIAPFPLSTESTELSTGLPTRETAAGAAPLHEVAELSTVRQGSTTTNTPGGRSAGADVVDTTASTPSGEVKSQRRRDPAFDALAEVTNSDPTLEGSELGRNLSLLRATDAYRQREHALGRHGADVWLADEIRDRARQYRAVFAPEIALTPRALIRNWARVTTMPERPLTPGEIADGQF